MSAELSVVVDDLVGAVVVVAVVVVVGMALEGLTVSLLPGPVFLLELASLALKFLTSKVISSRLQDVSTLSSISVSK